MRASGATWAAPSPRAGTRLVDRGTLEGGISLELEGPVLRVGTTDPQDVQPLIDALRGAGQTIRRVQAVRPSLEDLFIDTVTDPTTGKTSTPGAAFVRAAS